MDQLPESSEPQTYPWYAIVTRSRCEQAAADILRGKGFDQYLPTYRTRRKWSDRVVQLDSPLFPGYVFCRFDYTRRLPILTTPGVITIVGCGKDPAPIHEHEMQAVQSVVNSGFFTEPCRFLNQGEKVRVLHGALQGVEGILVREKAQCRMVVSVTMLQRSVSVEVDRDSVVPVSHPLAAQFALSK